MNQTRHAIVFPVLVAALGYFVDIYDMLLFSIIRIPSLQNLGLTDIQIRNEGEHILSLQMIGLLLGGFLWGILGDKKGRISVLFGSILLYSAANIANGFVQNVNQYGWIRFIAGLGLAGELGAGITLVSELSTKEKRGLATAFVAGLGLTGAVVAYFIKEIFVQPDNSGWRICYFIGGGLGILLLILRLSVVESGMFEQIRNTDRLQRGNFLMLFRKKERLKRYVLSILIGLPTWYVIGILVTFSKEFAVAMNITQPVDAGRAVMFAYAGLAAGDILIGIISQWFRSRKKALHLFYFITTIFIILYFTVQYNGSAARMYALCAGAAFGTGFWAIFVTMGAEQFGTNIRATAATTIPNVVRGMLPLMIFLFQLLRSWVNSYVTGAWMTGIVVIALGWFAVIKIPETFGKDLNYVEE
jgi:MFS family permease